MNLARHGDVAKTVGHHGTGIGDIDRMQLAVEVMGLKIEKFLQPWKIGRPVEPLPDESL